MYKRDTHNGCTVGIRIAGVLIVSLHASGSAAPIDENSEDESLFDTSAARNPHVVMVITKVDARSARRCPIDVLPSNPCEGDPKALCVKPQQYIRFEADDGAPIFIFWKDQHPMTACQSVDAEKKRLCHIKRTAVPAGKVDQPYEYGVARSECKPLDPRVIVKIR